MEETLQFEKWKPQWCQHFAYKVIMEEKKADQRNFNLFDPTDEASVMKLRHWSCRKEYADMCPKQMCTDCKKAEMDENLT